MLRQRHAPLSACSATSFNCLLSVTSKMSMRPRALSAESSSKYAVPTTNLSASPSAPSFSSQRMQLSISSSGFSAKVCSSWKTTSSTNLKCDCTSSTPAFNVRLIVPRPKAFREELYAILRTVSFTGSVSTCVVLSWSTTASFSSPVSAVAIAMAPG